MGRGEQNVLSAFKVRISECISMVGLMRARDRIAAVEFWNDVSEKLQEVVDSSAPEIHEDKLDEREDVAGLQLPEEVVSLQITDGQLMVSSPHPVPSSLVRTEPASLLRPATSKGQLLISQPATSLLSSTTTSTAVLRKDDPTLPKQGRPSSSVHNKWSGMLSGTLLLGDDKNCEQGNLQSLVLGKQKDSLLVLQDAKSEVEIEECEEECDFDDLEEQVVASEETVIVMGSEIGEEADQQILLNSEGSEESVNDNGEQQGVIGPQEGDHQHIIINQNDNQIMVGKSEAEENVEEGGHQQQIVTMRGSDGVEHQIVVLPEQEYLEQVQHPHPPSEDNIVTMVHHPPAEDTIVQLMVTTEIVDPAMASVETVTVDGQPPPVDESDRKRVRTDSEGAVEVFYDCEFCGKNFITPAQLTSHRWQHTKPFQCETCFSRFASKGNLVIHRRRHTGEKPYGCHMCSGKFSTKGNLKRHSQTHSGEKPWHCQQCGGRFTEKKSLKIHMRKHTGERPYACKVCGKRFAQTGILHTHMAMHLDQKTHLCDLCGRSFRQKSQLRVHMMRHDGVRKFNCNHCKARFLTKADLERHQRVHNGEKPYPCDLCGKTFTRQQSLNEHMNRHYGLRPYECKYCGKSFCEMSSVYKHIKTHEKVLVKSGDDLGQSEQHIIVHDIPHNDMDEVVNPTVKDDDDDDDDEDDMIADRDGDLMEEEDEVEDMVIELRDDRREGGEFILLETTQADGTVAVTEATVDADGNLTISADQEDIEGEMANIIVGS